MSLLAGWFAEFPMWAAWRRDGGRTLVYGRDGLIRQPSYDALGTLPEAVRWGEGVAIYLDWHVGLAVVNVKREDEDALKTLLRAFPSYAELSPSGKSVNVFYFVDDPDVKPVQGKRARFYDDRHFVPIGGKALVLRDGAPAVVSPFDAPTVAKPAPLALFALLARL